VRSSAGNPVAESRRLRAPSQSTARSRGARRRDYWRAL